MRPAFAKRVWFNGRTEASQALDEGSIPFTRSAKGSLSTSDSEPLSLTGIAKTRHSSFGSATTPTAVELTANDYETHCLPKLRGNPGGNFFETSGEKAKTPRCDKRKPEAAPTRSALNDTPTASSVPESRKAQVPAPLDFAQQVAGIMALPLTDAEKTDCIRRLLAAQPSQGL